MHIEDFDGRGESGMQKHKSKEGSSNIGEGKHKP